MLNIDKVIDDYNETVLEAKIKDEFSRKARQSENYYKVLDDSDSDIALNTNEISTSILSTASYISTPTIVEADQVRRVIINKKELLEALGIENSINNNQEEIELKVIVKGRNCDNTGKPINE